MATAHAAGEWAGEATAWDEWDAGQVDPDRESRFDMAFELFGDEEWQVSGDL
jgi:hypothetical protein